MAKVLQQFKLIVWDGTLARKMSLETLDRTTKDQRNNQTQFGGAGDFRQTLPVIPRSTPVNGLNPCSTFDRTKSVGVYIKQTFKN